MLSPNLGEVTLAPPTALQSHKRPCPFPKLSLSYDTAEGAGRAAWHSVSKWGGQHPSFWSCPTKNPSKQQKLCGGRGVPWQWMFSRTGWRVAAPGNRPPWLLEGQPCPTVHPAAVASLWVEKGKASLLRSVSSTSWRTMRLWGDSRMAAVKGRRSPACSEGYC